MAEWAEEHQHVTRVKYLSSMPGTAVYRETLAQGQIKSELDHANWLSVEQGLYDDEFLNLSAYPSPPSAPTSNGCTTPTSQDR